jgi:hypothetical protein
VPQGRRLALPGNTPGMWTRTLFFLGRRQVRQLDGKEDGELCLAQEHVIATIEPHPRADTLLLADARSVHDGAIQRPHITDAVHPAPHGFTSDSVTLFHGPCLARGPFSLAACFCWRRRRPVPNLRRSTPLYSRPCAVVVAALMCMCVAQVLCFMHARSSASTLPGHVCARCRDREAGAP